MGDGWAGVQQHYWHATGPEPGRRALWRPQPAFRGRGFGLLAHVSSFSTSKGALQLSLHRHRLIQHSRPMSLAAPGSSRAPAHEGAICPNLVFRSSQTTQRHLCSHGVVRDAEPSQLRTWPQPHARQMQELDIARTGRVRGKDRFFCTCTVACPRPQDTTASSSTAHRSRRAL